MALTAGGASLAARPAAFGSDGPLRGATMAMVYGTLRRFGRGDSILARLAHRGVPDAKIRALLLCALYAIESGSYAGHVAVDQAVRTCELIGKSAAKRFVNGMLRTFLREQIEIEAGLAEDSVAQWMHPDWWIDALRLA